MNSRTDKIKFSWGRLAIGIFLPAPIGVLSYAAFTIINKLLKGMSVKGGDFISEILFITIMAYVFVGLQSVVYSVLMEYLINRYVNNNVIVVMLSTLLGLILGPAWIILDSPSEVQIVADIDLSIFLAITGAITGLIVGIILRWLYVSSQNVSKKSVDDLV